MKSTKSGTDASRVAGLGGTIVVEIDVPYVAQKGSTDCVIACAMMLLKWGKDAYGDFVEFEYGELERVIGMGKSGSRLCDVENLNREKRISRHRWKPRLYCGPATSIEFIWNQLEKRKPVIVYLLKERPDGAMKHAVVVNGHSKDKTEITYLDPLIEEPVTESTGEFLSRWEELHRYKTHVEITEEYELTDFSEEEEE